ncbi:MAG: helix-turn-helix domain-containing protein [Gammaproteobacteria bacterium]
MTKRTHSNATTTPEMRAFIRESDLPVAALARLLKISPATVRKWKRRESPEDAPHTPHTLNTTLTPVQEFVLVELRKSLQLSLDDLLVITREYINPEASRAGIARCLKRHGVSRLVDLDGKSGVWLQKAQGVRVRLQDKTTHENLSPEVSRDSMMQLLAALGACEQDRVVNVRATQLPQFPGEPRQQRVLIANDPASDWVYVDIFDDQPTDAASRYMKAVLGTAPFHIRRILAGNYNQLLSRFRVMGDQDAEQTEDDVA